MVDNATGFAAAVHSEDGIAHIHTLQWDGRGEDIANVLPPATSLWFTKRWHGTLAASQMLAKMAADTASLILLGCIELDDRDAAQLRMIRRVELLAIVRMPGMRIIG